MSREDALANFCGESVRFDGTSIHCIKAKGHAGIHVARLSDPTGGGHTITWRAGPTFVPRGAS